MKRARGFSLVELMVAITLALIVTAGVMSVFVGSKNAFQSTAGVAAVSDSGRFALNFLDNAVRDAGNMACGAPIRTIYNVSTAPSPLATAVGPAPLLLFQPMTGFEAVNTGVGSAYGAVLTPGGTADWVSPPGWPAGLQSAFTSLPAPLMPIKNNDVLVVRSSTQGGTSAFVTASSANSLTMVGVPPNWAAPQLAVISDCVKSLVFQISNVAGNTIFHNAGGSPGNLTAAFPGTITFDAGSQVTLMQTTAYYIGVGADGDGALFSADLSASTNSFTSATSPNELVPDIEAMQILYGVDLNQQQTPSRYVTADQVTDFTTVMSVQIAVLAAGPLGSATLPNPARTYTLLGTTVTAPADTRLRQVFTINIAVRNLLP